MSNIKDFEYDYDEELVGEAKYKSKSKDTEFDPIKYDKSGNTESVVWTTKTLEKAVDAINKGLPLKFNPFCGRNTQHLRPDLVYKRTKEELDDYIHCMNDPIYFASKCYLMTPTGLQPVILRDYQIEYINAMKNNRFTAMLSCRQSGKSTTTAIFALWKVLFNVDKQCLILSKSGAAGRDLVAKIKDMYSFLPYHLKCGTRKYNQSEIAFDNNSSISTEAFSPTAGLGKTINFLILDEFAWLPGSAETVNTFYMNILPTVTTISDSNICIMSTQNGFNLFYRLYKAAVEGKSMYYPIKVDWDQVPQWNPEKKCWEKRTEEWHQMMVGVLGSEEAFQYQYGTAFSSSDKCMVSRETLKALHNNEVLYEVNNDLPASIQYTDKLTWDPNFDLETLKTGYFIVLIDLAEGGGNDYTVFNIIQVTEKDKFVQVGKWHANTVDIKSAALEFWLLWCQLFNNERTLMSIEWNTYGALFYQYLMNYNDSDYDPATGWRFNVLNGREELDTNLVIQYKKVSMEDEIADGLNNKSKTRPGIRWSGSSKKTACALLKFNLEKDNIIPTDLITIGELENFEDKNGNGSYEASEGHDDIIMTFCQIPMIMQTARYKDFIEDMEAGTQLAAAPGYSGGGWY